MTTSPDPSKPKLMEQVRANWLSRAQRSPNQRKADYSASGNAQLKITPPIEHATNCRPFTA